MTALQCARLGELKRDLEFVASPLVPQDTFWLGAGETPRCALEAVALEIFRKHAARRRRPPRTPSRASSGGPRSRTRHLPRSGAGGVLPLGQGRAGAHAARHASSPQLLTVTYLSEGGAPTVVLDKRPGLVHRRDCGGPRGGRGGVRAARRPPRLRWAFFARGAAGSS